MTQSEAYNTLKRAIDVVSNNSAYNNSKRAAYSDADKPVLNYQSSIDSRVSNSNENKQSTTTVNKSTPRINTAKIQEYYDMLEEYTDHFTRNDSALVWLARAVPSRSNKLAVPKSCRLPKSSSGQGGYAAAFKACNLTLRDSDTKSGHWHCWYYDSTQTDLIALQSALKKRWKQSPNYNPDAAYTVANLHSGANKNKPYDTMIQQVQPGYAVPANILPISYVHYDNNPHVVHDRLSNMYYGSPSLYTPQQPIQAIPASYNNYQQQMIQQQQLLQSQFMQQQLANNTLQQNPNPYVYQQLMQQVNPNTIHIQNTQSQNITDNATTITNPTRQYSSEIEANGSVPFTPTSKDANKTQLQQAMYSTQTNNPSFNNRFGNRYPFSTSELMSFSVAPSIRDIAQNAAGLLPPSYHETIVPNIAARMSSTNKPQA